VAPEVRVRALEAWSTVPPERVIPAAELAAHDTPADGWVAYDGVVYDLTAFLAAHPGGDSITAVLGRSCTEQVRASHLVEVGRMLQSPTWRARFGVVELGRLEEVPVAVGSHPWSARVAYAIGADIGPELRRRARAALASAELPALRRFGALGDVVALALVGALCWAVGMWLGHAWAAAGLGVVATLVGMKLGHPALHGGFAKHPWIRRLAGHGFDLIGGSSLVWEQEHENHHAQTNTELDTDLRHWPLLRMHPNQPRLRHHRFQHLYAIPLYSLIAPRWWAASVFETFKVPATPARRAGFVAFRLVNLALLATPFFIHPPLTATTLVALFFVSASYCTALVFAVTHVNDAVEFAVATPPGWGWTEGQIRTAANWRSGSPVWTWLSGGLNHQIEHHLFPAVEPRHYPRLAKVVREVCADHGIPYHAYPTWGGMMRAHLRALRRLGAEDQPFAAREPERATPRASR
jgi:fatty acid desaturase